ncbi:hypothetical protein B0T24DRAFT_647581 [Lasiosphaeria ovina]|uniref:Uncharacterized protein n=1 Tax=Lasiosphaeria ovina TaxID=92902 RepID=A0AAE0TUK3_9PEZI|nr:hypothetical protein B0T24DRAFT_647581 [Lasiosphaeria ovina]
MHLVPHHRETHGNGLAGLVFDNSGRGPLRVPGFVNFPVTVERTPRERFAHGALDWSQPPLLACEVAMLRLMNTITDKPDWHTHVFNERVVAEWARAETTIGPGCISELRDKAHAFAQTNCVTALDWAAGVCKSAIPAGLLEVLQTRAVLLYVEGSSNGDIVDPILFPLVYGRSLVLADGGHTGHRMFAASGQVSTAPALQHHRYPRHPLLNRTLRFALVRGIEVGSPWFSRRFQWLPFEVSFDEVMKTASTSLPPNVAIGSYINNLHPVSHKSLYETIEKLVSSSIEPWNQVLVHCGPGRLPPRIRTYGVLWSPLTPNEVEDICSRARGNKALHDTFIPAASRFGLRHWLLPEPGISFTYQEWKQTRQGRRRRNPEPDHELYNVSLQDSFPGGLQVILRMGSIELTPGRQHEDEDASIHDWHLDGLLNEHIVATSMVHFDSINVTQLSGALSFRVEASLDSSKHHYESGRFDTLAQIYGVDPRDLGRRHAGGGKALQELGTVAMADGRLLAYPNVLQHKIEPCALLDPSRPGRRRFLALHLIDPHYRVCSTHNEVVDQIVDLVDEWPMGIGEAHRLRGELLEEHILATEGVQHGVGRYNF